MKFEAKGLLRKDPSRVDGVVLTRGSASRTFRRAAGGWQENGSEVAVAAPLALDTAIKYLHNSEPVRTLSLAELQNQDAREFGLAPPQFTVGLMIGGASVFDAGFGSVDPSGMNYVGMMRRPELYLLSSFVAQEWDKVSPVTAPWA